MVRGTKYLFGEEADKFRKITKLLQKIVVDAGYQEFIPSILTEQEIFIEKAGNKILNQMYVFKDKSGRDICLIPEVTAIVQKFYKEVWSKTLPKPIKLFYLTRCYRYERPQLGRYREFWQFGVELLGGDKTDKEQVVTLLKHCLDSLNIKYTFNDLVKRGLGYYIEDGFEAEVKTLGAQKQVAGGGRYEGGIGWAIGVDRLMLAISKF